MSQHLRHVIYWVVVAGGIIPFIIAALGAIIYEQLDEFYAGLRKWCFREEYNPKGQPGPRRKPA